MNVHSIPEYGIWQAMLQRCKNPHVSSYHLYGGRGITVCKEWHSFKKFYSDMGPRPDPEYTIDRINNDLGYFKDNCHWTTKIQQANNKRNNRVLEFNGKSLTVSQWAHLLNISPGTIFDRIYNGWPVENALSTDDNRNTKFLTYQGKTLTITEWSKKLHVSRAMIIKRIIYKWKVQDIFEIPPRPRYKMLTYNNLTLSEKDWATRLNLHPKTISRRLRRGASIDEALSPTKEINRV